jgi:hypothetical protein
LQTYSGLYPIFDCNRFQRFLEMASPRESAGDIVTMVSLEIREISVLPMLPVLASLSTDLVANRA